MPAPNRWQQLVTQLYGGRLGFNRDNRLVSEGAVVAIEARDASGNITGLVGATGGVVLNLGSITNPVTRNALGQITAYTQGGVSYTVTYGSFGIAAITGGGFTLTQNYATNGIPSGVTLT